MDFSQLLRGFSPPQVDDGNGIGMPSQPPSQPAQGGNPLDMLMKLLDGTGDAGAGDRASADTYRAKERESSQAAFDMQAPAAVNPAFRLPDLLAIGLLAATTGKHFDKGLASYLGVKQQKAEQDTQQALRMFGQQQQRMLSEAKNFGGMADDADKRASHAEDLEQRRFGTAASFLGSQLNNQRTTETGLEKAQIGADTAITKQGMVGDQKLAQIGAKSEADTARDKAKMFGSLAKMTPEGRKAWALANGYDEAQSAAIGSTSPGEFLSQARAAKIPEEIKALQSKVKVDDARAKQIIEATRFIGPTFDLKRDQLALNVQNVHNLMRVRKAGIKLREDQVKMGSAAMNQARRSTTYLVSIAQKELGKLLSTENRTAEQEQRVLELENSIEQNNMILQELNEVGGLIPEITGEDVQQYNATPMGGIMPLPILPPGGGKPGTPFAQPPRGGYREDPPKTKVKPKRGGLQITNIRVSG